MTTSSEQWKLAVVHNPTTGQIMRTAWVTESEAALQAKPGEAVLVLDAGDQILELTSWVDGGALASRPAMPVSIDRSEIAADGVDEATVTGVPPGATVEMAGKPGAPVAVDDGEVVFSTPVAGEHRLIVRAFPFLDWSVMVTAS